MTSVNPFFVVPVAIGVVLLVATLALLRREAIHPRQFAVAVVLSILAILSPVIYVVLNAVAELLNFVYTFVLTFALAIVTLLVLVVYLVLLVGRLREETEGLWQEMALLRTEIDDVDGTDRE